MSRTKTLLTLLALSLVVLLSACIWDSTDSEITCDNFDRFLADCAGNCTPTWDCELSYGDLPYDDQIALDDCSDCMAANAAGGTCGDCSAPGVPSCVDFMESLLGVDCW